MLRSQHLAPIGELEGATGDYEIRNASDPGCVLTWEADYSRGDGSAKPSRAPGAVLAQSQIGQPATNTQGPSAPTQPAQCRRSWWEPSSGGARCPGGNAAEG